MELWISHVLRVGVLVAAFIVVVGGAIFLIGGPASGDPTSLHQLLNNDYANRTSIGSILHGVAGGNGTAIVDLGLLVLILTPVLRVAMTVLLFLLQKDWVFVLVTTIVLAILLFGLTGQSL